MENTSGQGATAEVPLEVDRWNWGAILFNWIWGIGNNTYRAFLVFVPFVGFIMLFVLGAKGSLGRGSVGAGKASSAVCARVSGPTGLASESSMPVPSKLA